MKIKASTIFLLAILFVLYLNDTTIRHLALDRFIELDDPARCFELCELIKWS